MSHESEPIFGIPPDLVIGPSADVLPLAGEVNWGVEAFQVDLLRSITDGAGVITGIVDTGVDRTHPLLANCFAARDFTGSASGDRDRNGHGTHCTGTVGASDPRIGMAPGCRTVHGKGLSDGGSGGGTGIAEAIRWCVEQGAEIISMSLGSSSEDTRITGAMREVSEKGVWVVAAAGNSGAGTPDVDWPGRSPYAVSVAALARDLSPASFTNAGAKIDTAYAGVNIWSTRTGGGFQQMSGTSMATPGVAGVLTLYRSALKKHGQPIPTIAELRAMLRSDSTDTHTPGVDRRTGPGWITPILLALNLTPDPPRVGG
jgi:subtilisin